MSAAALVVAAIVAGTWPGQVTAASAAAPLASLLPSTDRIAPWKAAGPAAVYDAQTLHELLNGGAELYLDYGVQQAVTAEYADGAGELACTVFELRDADGAFGLFSRARGPGKAAVNVGDGGVAGGFQLAFWQDRYFVTIEAFADGPGVPAALGRFADAIAAGLGRHAGRPRLLDPLGRPGLIAGSERLFAGRTAADLVLERLGDGAARALGLTRGDWVALADYRVSDHPATLTAIAFDSEARAAAAGRALRAAMCGDGRCAPADPGAAADGWTRDGRVYIAWRGADRVLFLAEGTEAATLFVLGAPR